MHSCMGIVATAKAGVASHVGTSEFSLDWSTAGLDQTIRSLLDRAYLRVSHFWLALGLTGHALHRARERNRHLQPAGRLVRGEVRAHLQQDDGLRRPSASFSQRVPFSNTSVLRWCRVLAVRPALILWL